MMFALWCYSAIPHLVVSCFVVHIRSLYYFTVFIAFVQCPQHRVLVTPSKWHTTTWLNIRLLQYRFVQCLCSLPFTLILDKTVNVLIIKVNVLTLTTVFRSIKRNSFCKTSSKRIRIAWGDVQWKTITILHGYIFMKQVFPLFLALR